MDTAQLEHTFTWCEDSTGERSTQLRESTPPLTRPTSLHASPCWTVWALHIAVLYGLDTAHPPPTDSKDGSLNPAVELRFFSPLN